MLHISRHGAGHPRLSNHVTHRANIAALKALGATGVLAVTVCGAVDPSRRWARWSASTTCTSSSNRLPDGSLCTFFTEPGALERGHWIYEGPFSSALRAALLARRRAAGVAVRDGGCYGHVDGPRFNTRAEIRGLAACGVTAVSQTAGPETVLCGEAELPYALLGFLTDYANGVKDEATPVETLVEMMAASSEAFAAVLGAALPLIDAPAPPASSTASRRRSRRRGYRLSESDSRGSATADRRRLGLAGDAEVVVAERLRAAAPDAQRHAVLALVARTLSASSSSVDGPGSPPSFSSSSSPRMIVVKALSPWSASVPTKRSRWVPRRSEPGIRSV